MRDIFCNASRVLVWLGLSHPQVEEALEYLQDPNRSRTPDRKWPILGLQRLYNCPWFSRMWVLPETIMQKDPLVICGNKHASWEAVNTMLYDVVSAQIGTQRGDLFFSHAEAMLYFTVLRDEKHGDNSRGQITLESLLQASHNRLASDPRDHIYALLGLVSDPSFVPFEPDYTKSASFAYQNAMISVCKSRQDLEWLHYAARGGASVKPSWCIDFSTNTWIQDAYAQSWEILSLKDQERAGKRAAPGRERMKILHDPENGTIRLRGIEIGHIDIAYLSSTKGLLNKLDASPMHDRKDDEEIFVIGGACIDNIINDVYAFTPHAHRALKSRLEPCEASEKVAAGDVWKVAAGGLTFEYLLETAEDWPDIKRSPEGYSLLEKYVQATVQGRVDISHEWADLRPEAPTDFYYTAVIAISKIGYHATDRCFFSTNTGYIGRAGHSVRQGDVLCILFGCSRPLVLRPQENGCYELITLTYTDDVMDGEFLKDIDSMGKERSFL